MKKTIGIVLSLTLTVLIVGSTNQLFAETEIATKNQITSEERQQILDLISRYTYTWDGKQAEKWASLYEDKLNLQRRIQYAQRRFDDFSKRGIQTRHYQTNTLLSKDISGKITGVTMFSVAWQHKGESAPKLVHTGTYTDEYVNTSSGWKFAKRELLIDHE